MEEENKPKTEGKANIETKAAEKSTTKAKNKIETVKYPLRR